MKASEPRSAFPLQLLLGDVPVDKFRSEIYERRPCLFAQAIHAEQLCQLFSLEQLDELFSNVDLRYPQIELIEKGMPGRPPTLTSGVVDRIRLLSKLRAGASVRIRDLQKLVPRTMEIARGLAQELFGAVFINAYVTPPGFRGLNPHFDDHDVFIVQCFGDKEWAINRDYERRIDLPNPYVIAVDDDHKRLSDPASEEKILLREGDVLYLPRGTLHYASATAKGSAHLTIAYVPITRAGLLRLALNRAELSQTEFRRAAYRDLVNGSREGKSQAVETLRKLLASADLADGIAAAYDQIRASFPAPSDGILSAIFAPVEIGADTQFALRTNGLFTLKRDPSGSAAGVVAHQTTLAFDGREKAYFAKLCELGHFRPKDLADDDMETCIPLLTQLLQHGVICIADD